MNRNIDILLWSSDVVSKTVERALQKYTDITLFGQNCTFNGFFPDLVVLTASDVRTMLLDRLEAIKRYPHAKIVYVRKTIDAAVLGICLLTGIDGLLSTSLTGRSLAKSFRALSESDKFELTPKKRANLVVKHTADYNRTTLTLRQLAILSLLTRNMDYNTISKLLCTTTGDVYIAESMICSKLKIPRSALRSYDMLADFGAIERGVKYKAYKIEPVMRRAGYYLVPRFYEEKTNK